MKRQLPSHLRLVYSASENPDDYQLQGNAYTECITQQLGETCLRLGLHVKFLPIINAHMEDVRLRFHKNDGSKDPEFRLELRKFVRETESKTVRKKDEELHRVSTIGLNAVRSRARLIDEVLTATSGVRRVSKARLEDLSSRWLLWQQSAVIIGNSCLMQRKFGKYFPDLDAQSGYYLGEHELSADYIRRYGNGRSVAETARNFQQGFGIMMMHEDLLADGIVARAERANWIVNAIRNKYPDAHRSDKIRAHLEIEPVEHPETRPNLTPLPSA